MSKKRKEAKQFNPYDIDKVSKISTGLKVFILKTWTFGAIFFFFHMGLDWIDATDYFKFVLVLTMSGLLYYYFICYVIEFMDNTKNNIYKYMPLKRGKFRFIFYFLYSFLVGFIVIMLGSILIKYNLTFSKITFPQADASWDPFMYGLLFYFVDYVILLIKNIIIKVRRKKYVQDNLH